MFQVSFFSVLDGSCILGAAAAVMAMKMSNGDAALWCGVVDS